MLHYATITPTLSRILIELMVAPEFSTFRLVGGTSLSLQRGHRQSVDIDLFTDAPYDSVDFEAIDRFLRSNYVYVHSTQSDGPMGMGLSYFIGHSEEDSVKLDLYYTESFIRPAQEVDGIRLASVEDIIAMKLEVIARGGRKKDFWDLHDLIDDFTFEEMYSVYCERNRYGYSRAEINAQFTNFDRADEDFDPICVKQKYWELIKLDLIMFVQKDL